MGHVYYKSPEMGGPGPKDRKISRLDDVHAASLDLLDHDDHNRLDSQIIDLSNGESPVTAIKVGPGETSSKEKLVPVSKRTKKSEKGIGPEAEISPELQEAIDQVLDLQENYTEIWVKSERGNWEKGFVTPRKPVGQETRITWTDATDRVTTKSVSTLELLKWQMEAHGVDRVDLSAEKEENLAEQIADLSIENRLVHEARESRDRKAESWLETMTTAVDKIAVGAGKLRRETGRLVSEYSAGGLEEGAVDFIKNWASMLASPLGKSGEYIPVSPEEGTYAFSGRSNALEKLANAPKTGWEASKFVVLGFFSQVAEGLSRKGRQEVKAVLAEAGDDQTPSEKRSPALTGAEQADLDDDIFDMRNESVSGKMINAAAIASIGVREFGSAVARTAMEKTKSGARKLSSGTKETAKSSLSTLFEAAKYQWEEGEAQFVAGEALANARELGKLLKDNVTEASESLSATLKLISSEYSASQEKIRNVIQEQSKDSMQSGETKAPLTRAEVILGMGSRRLEVAENELEDEIETAEILTDRISEALANARDEYQRELLSAEVNLVDLRRQLDTTEGKIQRRAQLLETAMTEYREAVKADKAKLEDEFDELMDKEEIAIKRFEEAEQALRKLDALALEAVA